MKKSIPPILTIAFAALLANCGLTLGAGNTSPDPDAGPPGGSDSSPGTSSSSGSSSGSAGSSSGGSSSSSSSGAGSSSGGSSSSGSSSGSPPPVDAGPAPTCKRGVAMNAAPSSAFARTATNPGVAWWYDWGNEPASGGPPPGIEFVPMIWGTGALNGPIPNGSKYVLGFNEPNFSNQSNMTEQVAAQNWPFVQSLAMGQGIPTVGPGLNFCGSPGNTSGCSDPSVTDPYTFLRNFLAACPACEIDHIAVHWYNCDLPSLQAYIDGNATLEGWVQFGKPIWLTEFSCDGSHSVAEQQAYMQAAVDYLENNPHVFRYSWFSAGAIPTSLLQASDGSLTDLGQTYVSLPTNCP